MGLNKETRDFFTGRINRVLDEKLKNARKNIDEDKLQAHCIELLCKKTGFSASKIERYKQIQNEKSKLEEEANEISDEACNALRKLGHYNPYRYNSIENVLEEANKKFEEDALNALYPEVVPLIKKIETIKEDVHATVLLATTEPKLVAKLSELLKNYGGDISELLKLIPPE